MITPINIHNLSDQELQSIGITMKKALYIKNIAFSIINGTFDLNHLFSLSDEEVINKLSS
jgi:DNA-3-methyladenine glycosylase II